MTNTMTTNYFEVYECPVKMGTTSTEVECEKMNRETKIGEKFKSDNLYIQ